MVDLDLKLLLTVLLLVYLALKGLDHGFLMPLKVSPRSHVLLHQLSLSLNVLQLSQQGLMLILYHEYVLFNFCYLDLYFGSLKVDVFHGFLEEEGLLLAVSSEGKTHPVLLTL